MTPGRARDLYIRAHAQKVDLTNATLLAAIKATGRVDPLGRELMRLTWLNDRRAFGPVLRKSQGMCRAALTERWPELRGTHAKRLAAKGLRQWLISLCPECEGRRKMKIPGAPVLSEDDCPACAGTGKWLAPTYAGDYRSQIFLVMSIYNRQLARAVSQLVELLESA